MKHFSKKLKIIALAVILFAGQMKAQLDTLASHTGLSWFSFGAMLGGNVPHPKENGLPNVAGINAGLNFGGDKWNVEIKGYGISDGKGLLNSSKSDAVPNRIANLKSISISGGPRYNFGHQSMIVSVGVSMGSYDYRKNVTDTIQGGPFILISTNRYDYVHDISIFAGMLVSAKYIISSENFGGEFTAYCNVHQYTDFGLSAALAFGNVSHFKRKQKSRERN